jgi:hypothetical protein
MKPGDVQPFKQNKAIVAAFGIWAERGKDGWLHIHMTGDNKDFKHVTVVNNPNSKTRYNRVLFRDLRRLFIAQGKWPFGIEGVETEKRRSE